MYLERTAETRNVAVLDALSSAVTCTSWVGAAGAELSSVPVSLSQPRSPGWGSHCYSAARLGANMVCVPELKTQPACRADSFMEAAVKFCQCSLCLHQ